MFSKRHETAIFEKKLQLSLSKRLRRRLWYTLQKYNFEFSYRPDPYDNWQTHTDALTEIQHELKQRYGVESLKAFTTGDTRAEVDLEGFVAGAYPAQVLDVIELLYDQLSAEQKLALQAEVNSTLEEESSEWRLTDGQFFKIDSEFLALHVVARSCQLLKAEGFGGALDEFNEARNDLLSGNSKGAIHNACKSFESVLKTILAREDGNASTLIREIVQTDFCGDLPEKLRIPFGEQVLNCLPCLRNRLAGHGQGTDVVEVPRLYAELSVNMAAVFNLFAIQKAVTLKQQQEQMQDPKLVSQVDDDIPF